MKIDWVKQTNNEENLPDIVFQYFQEQVFEVENRSTYILLLVGMQQTQGCEVCKELVWI
jgi:hypothetical protein